MLRLGVVCGMVFFEKRLIGSAGWEEIRWPKSHNASDPLMTLNPKSGSSLTGRKMNEAIKSQVLPDYVNRFPLENVRGVCCHYPANKLAQSSLSQSEPFYIRFYFWTSWSQHQQYVCDVCDATLSHRPWPGCWIFNHLSVVDADHTSSQLWHHPPAERSGG